MSFRSRLFLWSWLWWGSDMFWMNVLLSVLLIWWYWRKRCPWRLLIARISRSYRAVLLLFWLIFVHYSLSLFLLILMFDNNLNLLFWGHAKYFPFSLFSLAGLFGVINRLPLIAQITIVLNLLQLYGTAACLHFIRLLLEPSLSNVPIPAITGLDILPCPNRILLDSSSHNVWRLIFIFMLMIIFIVAITQYLLLFNFNGVFLLLKLPVIFFLIKRFIIDGPQSWILLLLSFGDSHFFLRRGELAVWSLRCDVRHIVFGLSVRGWQYVLLSLVSAPTL